MKILHTSDWHLGRSLYGRNRYEEGAAFLDWLLQTIEKEHVDALLVAGDVFDSGTPSNKAQELYYTFLCRVAASCCQHVVVVAGNHDSPSFLNAPRDVLRALHVYVVGAAAEKMEDEVIVVYSEDVPQAVICAVPYLRDKDIRTVTPGESIDDKNAKLVAGVREHYAKVCAYAAQKKADFSKAGYNLPLIATGHLFTAGGKTLDDDGVRELYVGSLAHVERDVFPTAIDYLALGHLHIPQKVGGAEHMRYSGSPLPMGYGEARQQKQVVLVTFAGTTPDIQTLPVPCFQELVRIVGDIEVIRTQLAQLVARNSAAWLEIEYTGAAVIGNLREVIDTAIAGSALEVRRIKNRRIMERVIDTAGTEEDLEHLDAKEVFRRCLDAHEVPEDERSALMVSYDEILTSLHEQDRNAE